MKSIQQLEIKAAELFKNRQYSKVVFEITSETTEEERSAFLCNMLGLSKNANNNKNKDVLISAIKDFKYGYLKEKNREKLESLINFHFVEGEFTTENVENSINTKSINGLDLEIKNVNGILYVNGAEVVESDIKFSNGIIHLTNRVLIPK